ncbi:MAG: tetratricopeptide repeat protein [Nitrospirota bacterium]
MPKAIKKKVKKRTVGTETEVKDRLHDIKESLQKKQKTVFVYSIIAASAVLVIAGILFYNYNARQKSGQLEYEAYKIYYDLYQKNTPAKQEKYQKALELFQQAYSKKKSPRLLLYIADAYSQLGRYDEALNTLNAFTNKYIDEKNLLPLAYNKMAVIYLKKGNKDEALKTLDSLYKLPVDIYKDMALIESARILENDGKKAEAASKYKELTEKFPESPFYEEAKNRLGENKGS